MPAIMGRGTVDAQGYPWLWHDIQPDTGDGKARTPEGLVNDPHGNGVKGYVVSNCKNVTFQDLFLLRSAYWTVTVSNTDGFTSRNIKLISRKQQYHDDAYDITGGSKHILIENGFAMTMDDALPSMAAPAPAWRTWW
jgi:polygalacturonase